MIRFVQIHTEIVHVVCPYCGADQPNKQGDDQWTKEQLKLVDSTCIECVACEKQMEVFSRKDAIID